MKHYTSPRIQRAQLFLMKVSSYLEIVCALILIVAILIAFVPVPHNLYSLYLDNGFDLSDFMKKSFDLVIGVELLKMFCRHDIDSIVEVLLFSVARQMVIDHLAIKEALIGCVAVAILFAVRRFLFVPILDNPDEQERKLEKDQYIKERIADAIAAYKKEIGATSLRERAESSINTAAADPLNEKEASRGNSPLPASFSFLYDAIRFFPRKAVFLLRSPYINGAISRIAFPQNLCSAGSASTPLFCHPHAFRQCLIKNLF